VRSLPHARGSDRERRAAMRTFASTTTATISDILLAVNGEASPHEETRPVTEQVSGPSLPRSVGRVSSLARERPVALSRALPPASESSTPGFSGRLSQAVMPHGTVGSVTLPRPVGRVPVLTNDANPQSVAEPTRGNRRPEILGTLVSARLVLPRKCREPTQPLLTCTRRRVLSIWVSVSNRRRLLSTVSDSRPP